MKRLLLLIALALLITGADFAPNKFTVTNFTKSVKYKIKALRVITFQTSNASTVYLNGKGAGWPVAAANSQDLYRFRNVSTVTFTCASTAAASPTKLYVEEAI